MLKNKIEKKSIRKNKIFAWSRILVYYNKNNLKKYLTIVLKLDLKINLGYR